LLAVPEDDALGAIGPEGVSAVGSEGVAGACCGGGFCAGCAVFSGGSGLTSPWLNVGDW
jgi:hypothetical protein